MQLLSEFIGSPKIKLVGVGVSRLRERDERDASYNFDEIRFCIVDGVCPPEKNQESENLSLPRGLHRTDFTIESLLITNECIFGIYLYQLYCLLYYWLYCQLQYW